MVQARRIRERGEIPRKKKEKAQTDSTEFAEKRRQGPRRGRPHP